MKIQDEAAATATKQVADIIAECPRCNGSGVVARERWLGAPYARPEWTCSECHGSGLVERRDGD